MWAFIARRRRAVIAPAQAQVSRTFPRDKGDTYTGWLRSRSGGVPPSFFMFIAFLHITSSDGPLLGFKKSRSRGKDVKLRQEKAKMRKKTKH